MIQGRSKCIGHTYYARQAIASGFAVDVMDTEASASNRCDTRRNDENKREQRNEKIIWNKKKTKKKKNKHKQCASLSRTQTSYAIKIHKIASSFLLSICAFAVYVCR